MVNIDFSKAGATTILSCGTTNAGHYVFIQQGVGSWTPNEIAKGIFDKLAKFAPLPPGKDWKLIGVDLQDYKSGGKFYRIHANYQFRKDKAKYSEEIDIIPEIATEIYKIFSEAVYKYK